MKGRMSRKAADPMVRMLELYKELDASRREAALAAMTVFSGEPTQPKEKRQPKPAPKPWTGGTDGN